MRQGTFSDAVVLAAGALIAVVIMASSTCAGELLGKYSILGSGAPTPGLPGYTTYTLSLQTDVAEVGALDFLGGRDVGEFGFFGPMHQVHPSDVGTVFSDHNGLIDAFGGDWRQDSQFLFRSSDILSIRPGESDESLHAAFAGFESFGTDFDFAQIVVADGQEVSFNGQLAYRDQDLDLPVQSFAGVVGTGVLFEADVFRPQAPVLPEPVPTPTPVPVPIPTPLPEPQPNPPPELIVEIDPADPGIVTPADPEPIGPNDPVIPDDPGFVVFPILEPIDWGPGWIQLPEGVVGGPYVIDHIELPPRAIITIDTSDTSTEISLDGRMELFASDGDVPYVLLSSGAMTYAAAHDGALGALLSSNMESQVPEPVAWCQALLAVMGILSVRRFVARTH